jgi:peptidoglycan/LPS O-acetylase OafA/YrhL
MTNPPSKQLDALTGLRFLAAIAVVFHHSIGVFFTTESLAPYPLGAGGVSMFFVLSGFILTYRHPSLPAGRDILRFYVARIARIWPVHLFTLGMVVMLLPTVYSGPLITGANILMVHAWIPMADYFFSYNTLSWSISTEWGFYLLFPLLLRLRWPLKLIIPAVLVIGGIAVCHVFALPPYDGRNVISTLGILYFNPLVRLFEFAFGMCSALLYARTRHHLGNSIWLWTVAEVAAASACVWYVLIERVVLYSYASSSAIPVSREYVGYDGFAPIFALLIFALSGERGLLARILGCAPFVFLGEIYATQ